VSTPYERHLSVAGRSYEDLLKKPVGRRRYGTPTSSRADTRATSSVESVRFRKGSVVNMMGVMDQAHLVLHQLMMWFHQMSGIPMMNMPM